MASSRNARLSSTTMISSRPAAKSRTIARLERADGTELEQPDAAALQLVVVEAERRERLPQREVGRAGRDDADLGVAGDRRSR